MATEEDPRSQDLIAVLQKLASVPAWPLDKPETFAAFALMGLTSRLQPVAKDNQVEKARLVALAKELGVMAAADEPSKGK